MISSEQRSPAPALAGGAGRRPAPRADPDAALTRATIVLLADAVLRAWLGPESAPVVPTGVATTILGAVVLVLLARRAGDSGPLRRPRSSTCGASTTTHPASQGVRLARQAQVPAGLVVAIIGAPYFLLLLHRSRG